MKKYLKQFAHNISISLSKKNMIGKTVTIKIKTSSFVSHTRSKTLNDYIKNEDDIYYTACEILDDIEFEDDIRLIGLTLSGLMENKIEQLTLDDFL